MPNYVTLVKWTEEGAKSIKESPARLKAAATLTEAMGGKFTDTYFTLGEYDMVVISEGSSDEGAAAAALAIVSRGFVRTVTMRAFTLMEFEAILKQLP
jgi:uncharacterized protein with GYD domain